MYTRVHIIHTYTYIKYYKCDNEIILNFFITGFRQAITKYTPLIEAWKKINHPNIVQLKDVFLTKAFNDSCK